MRSRTDTILCHDKEDAKACIDNIGSRYIDNWEFLPGGKVRLILNCKVKVIPTERLNQSLAMKNL